jgi:hypothetical protein
MQQPPSSDTQPDSQNLLTPSATGHINRLVESTTSKFGSRANELAENQAYALRQAELIACADDLSDNNTLFATIRSEPHSVNEYNRTVRNRGDLIVSAANAGSLEATVLQTAQQDPILAKAYLMFLQQRQDYLLSTIPPLRNITVEEKIIRELYGSKIAWAQEVLTGNGDSNILQTLLRNYICVEASLPNLSRSAGGSGITTILNNIAFDFNSLLNTCGFPREAREAIDSIRDSEFISEINKIAGEGTLLVENQLAKRSRGWNNNWKTHDDKELRETVFSKIRNYISSEKNKAEQAELRRQPQVEPNAEPEQNQVESNGVWSRLKGALGFRRNS